MARNIAEDGLRIDEDVPNNVRKRRFVAVIGAIVRWRAKRVSSQMMQRMAGRFSRIDAESRSGGRKSRVRMRLVRCHGSFWNLSQIAHKPFVLSLRQAQARVRFAYRSTNGPHGRDLEQFALRYLRANGKFDRS
jgi:hypothetical protein